MAFAIRTPAGTVVHTGDFKIDCTPIMGGMIDLSAFARVGDEGVLALLAQSNNRNFCIKRKQSTADYKLC